MPSNPPDAPDTGIEMRNMTPEEQEEFNRMSRVGMKPILKPDSGELERLTEHARGVLARGFSDLDGFARGVVALSAEVASLRSTALTREEAECLLWELDRDEDHPYFTAYAFAATIAKLKAISSKRQPQQPNLTHDKPLPE